ncbi:AGE family epimerase/isomerase [Paenibacillus endoradicis]|uniref:AGE family epimerase/isomerase n=1 Tax=Paenibacillus endoradicis TaxID=2972487 RepID=UPI0021598716|nr:AGE family epimerase/isomerase [Paenibacillus endoradicis]MCR8659592.1 AGE family epimerase/isomerase [Paenibacillus endoradicis]
MSNQNANLQWKEQFELELKEGILDFWLKHSIDDINGGFVGEVRRDLTVIEYAPKSLVLNTRILWTFSVAYRLYQKSEYLTMAQRAYHYLNDHFIDCANGGLYWMLNARGEPLETKKQIYGQAFAIYAFSEYYRAVQDETALAQAIELFQLLEQHGYDINYKGYIEALSIDWEDTDDLSLSDKDLNEKKSMNTHLHIMEAYTNLYRVWPSEPLSAKLRELIEITIENIVDSESGHFFLFFDEQWNSQSAHVSYGHDIEGSWLLVEAAEVLGDVILLERVKHTALQMAEAVLLRGIDVDGALFNEAEHGQIIDDHKDWWPQAEAVVGFYNAYQLTNDDRFLNAAKSAWDFIDKYLIDRQYGEWYWSVTRDGTPSDNLQKISAWKCPYHNSRMCFEMLLRL